MWLQAEHPNDQLTFSWQKSLGQVESTSAAKIKYNNNNNNKDF